MRLISVAITKYLRLSSSQREGLQYKVRRMPTLMVPHSQSQQGGKAEKETATWESVQTRHGLTF